MPISLCFNRRVMAGESEGTGESSGRTGMGGKMTGRAGIFWALLSYLWQEKLWWMIPMVVVLVLFGGLAMLAGSAGIAPFVYTLF